MCGKTFWNIFLSYTKCPYVPNQRFPTFHYENKNKVGMRTERESVFFYNESPSLIWTQTFQGVKFILNTAWKMGIPVYHNVSHVFDQKRTIQNNRHQSKSNQEQNYTIMLASLKNFPDPISMTISTFLFLAVCGWGRGPVFFLPWKNLTGNDSYQ